MSGNRDKGNEGERLAAAYLADRGYNILETNYRCRSGEIDIIARHSGYIVFVEVKLRTSLKMGYPREAVDERKQRRIRNAALSFLLHKHMCNADMRFDVIEIISTGEVTIEHIENAF